MHVHVQVMEVANLTVHNDAPWDTSQSIGRALLTPTTIYVNDILKLHSEVLCFAVLPHQCLRHAKQSVLEPVHLLHQQAGAMVFQAEALLQL
jgi:uncharacterized membrane protein